MIYKNTNNCIDINFFFEKRRVFLDYGISREEVFGGDKKKKPDGQASLYALENSSNLPGNPEKDRVIVAVKKDTAAKLGGLQSELSNPETSDTPEAKVQDGKGNKAGTKEKAGDVSDKPVTLDQGIRRTKKRLDREIFGDETMKPYSEKLKAAIEKIGEDGLRKFIESHKEYSGNFASWNADFCTAFSLELKQDVQPEDEQRKYAAALQIYLAEYFKDKQKSDVFQTTQKANPFIYIDGKLGGYTMSVLAAYWNDKYPDKKKEKGEIGYASLEKEFGEKRKNNEIYGKAVDYLKACLSGKILDNTSVSNNVVAPNAESAKGSDKPVSPGNEGEKSNLTPDERAKQTKEWNDAMERVQKDPKLARIADILVQTALSEKIVSRVSKSVDGLNKRFDKIQTNDGDPFNVHTDASDFYSGSKDWTSVLFRKYRDAFTKARTEPSEDNIKEAERLFVMLGYAPAEYSEMTKNIVAKLKAKYEPALRNLVGKYSIPTNTDFRYLSPNESSTQYYEQLTKVTPNALREQGNIDAFYTKYFKEAPIRTFASWDELSSQLKNSQDLKRYFVRVSERDILERVNNIILLKNMNTVYWGYKWYKDQFNKDLTSSIASLNSGYEEYYANYRDKKGKDYVADLIGGKIEKANT